MILKFDLNNNGTMGKKMRQEFLHYSRIPKFHYYFVNEFRLYFKFAIAEASKTVI